MPAGRPPLFKTAEEMQAVIDKYFSDVANDENEYVTISGLAYELGMTRQSLCNYENKDEFFDTIKRAKAKAESEIEKRLMSGQAAAGAIFNLKNNFGWRDKSEQDLNVNGRMTLDRKVKRLDGTTEET